MKTLKKRPQITTITCHQLVQGFKDTIVIVIIIVVHPAVRSWSQNLAGDPGCILHPMLEIRARMPKRSSTNLKSRRNLFPPKI